MENEVLNAALNYLNRGFSVIPVRQDKKPFVKWEPYQTQRARPEDVRRWWKEHPDAMIGICTGALSGVSVIDIDEDQGREELQKYIPESLLMPTVRTPSGGQHLYFHTPSPPIGNNARVIPGCDFRGEGGYVVAPPSVNGTGKHYAWMPGLSIDKVAPPDLPAPYINKIINSNGYMRSGKNESQRESVGVIKSHLFFEEGGRDETLFHIANTLFNGGMDKDGVLQVIDRIAKTCNPPFPYSEAKLKVESAFERKNKRSLPIAAVVNEFVRVSDGHFSVIDCQKESAAVTSEDKHAVRQALYKLKEQRIIEKFGGANGCYRRVDKHVEAVDFLNAPTDEFPVQWPLSVHQFTVIYPGNIVIVAGSKSAGKTAFLLNTVRLNQDRHEVVYLNSEMGDTEFRKRLELFEGVPLSSWKVKAYHRNSNFADLITGEKKIFIVDFLEVTTDFWKVAQYIQEIHRKLKEGVCIIALQKSDAKEMGRGGDFSKEKARLYLALDYLAERKCNRIKIVDAKAWRTSQNPRGMERFYKLINGSKFVSQGEWID